MNKNFDINVVTGYAKQGLKGTQIAKKMGMNYQTLFYYVKQAGYTFTDLQKEYATPQNRAWVTIRKNKAIEAYKAATSAGIKAGIARQFKKEFGVEIKAELAPKVQKVEREKKVVTTKEVFAQKEFQLMLPKSVQSLVDKINELERRLSALEK